MADIETLVFMRFKNESTWRADAVSGYDALRDGYVANTSSMGSPTVELVEVAVLRRSTIQPKRVEVAAEVSEHVNDVDIVPVAVAPAPVTTPQTTSGGTAK